MDILGFLFWAAIVIAPPPQVRMAIDRLRDAFQHLRDVMRGYEATIRSELARRFLLVSLALAVVEIILAATHLFLGGRDWRLLVYVPVLVFFQAVFAVWNYQFRLRSRPVPVPIPMRLRNRAGLTADWADAWSQQWLTANPERDLAHFTATFCKPLVWFAIVPAIFLLQGMDMQIHALDMPNMDLGISFSGHDYSFHQRQLLELVAFGSLMVFGAFAVALGGFINWVLRKGTKLVEFLSTKTAQFVLAVAPEIKFSDTMSELGGPVDILDEDYAGAVVEFLLTSPFIPFVMACLGVIVLPNYVWWFILMLTSFISGMVTWLYSRSGKEAHEEIKHDLAQARRVAFKLVIPGTLVVTTLVFASIFLKQDLFNAWYGVTFYAYRSWLVHLVYVAAAAGVLAVLFKVFSWLSRVGKVGSWQKVVADALAVAAICLIAVTFLFGAANVFAGLQDIRDIKTVRLNAAEMPGAVAFVDKDGKVVDTAAEVAETTTVDDEVRIKFQTKAPAIGILEFLDPKEAMKSGLPAYKAVGPRADDEGHCGKSEDKPDGESCDLYKHSVTFMPGNYNGGYRLVMRNADEKSKRLYGNVQTKVLDKPLRRLDSTTAVKKGFGSQLLRSLGFEPSETQEASSTHTARATQGSRVASAPKPCPTLIPIPGFD